MTEEEYCYQQLAALRRSYEIDAKPYLDRLAQIKSREPITIPYLFITEKISKEDLYELYPALKPEQT